MMLSELLEIPVFSNSQLVAGQQGVNRMVHSVNMMDAPDIIDFLKPNELLITTAYAIKDQPERLKSLVAHMAEAGCAGLAIKTKRFLDEIPASVIKTADHLHFPLIELPLDYSLGEFVNQSLGSILQQKNDELRYALETHRQFSNLVLRGHSLSQIIEALSNLIDAPVVLLSPKLTVTASSHHFKQEQQNPLLQDIGAWLASYPQPLSSGEYSIHCDIPYHHILIQPIETYQLHGYVALLASGQQDNLTFLAMEQAANVIGFELMKELAVKERTRRYKNEFFSDLVEGRITSEQEMMNRGKQYGLKQSDSYLCVVARKDPVEAKSFPQTMKSDEKGVMERDLLYDALKTHCHRHLQRTFIYFMNNDVFVVLIPLEEEQHSATIEQQLEQSLREISDNIEEEEHIAISFGVGNLVTKLLDIPITYKQALDALSSGYHHKKTRFVQFYHAKELADLLRLIPVGELVEFYHDTFRNFADLEDKERKEWMRTLQVYYECHCHIADTAKRLFVHRNTVIYRLDRIEQLLGIDLRNSVESLRFRVAFLIEHLLE